MKKLIALLLVLLATTYLGVSAQDAPKVLYSLSVGYMPLDQFGLKTPAMNIRGFSEVTKVVVTDVYLGVQYHNFFVGGGSLTKMVKNENHLMNFIPYYNEYNFNLGWRFKSVTIEYEHICGHDVVVWSGSQSVAGSNQFNKASDKISITLSNF